VYKVDIGVVSQLIQIKQLVRKSRFNS